MRPLSVTQTFNIFGPTTRRCHLVLGLAAKDYRYCRITPRYRRFTASVYIKHAVPARHGGKKRFATAGAKRALPPPIVSIKKFALIPNLPSCVRRNVADPPQKNSPLQQALYFFGGLIMMCAPAVPGDISHGALSLALVDNPVDCGVAKGT